MQFTLLWPWNVRYYASYHRLVLIAFLDRPNWQDWGGRWTRRTQFMRHLKTVLEELEVAYSMPIQPVILPKYSPFNTSFPSHPQSPDASPQRNGRNIRGH